VATRPGDPGPGQREERPPLAGGERLRRTVDRTSAGGPKFHPQTFEDAQRVLTPQLYSLQAAVAEMPATLRGARVVFEATVLPNYLANSYFPRELFEEADLVPVGTRSSVAEHVTAAREPAERQTKTYLVAGDERSLQQVAGLLSGEVGQRGRLAAARDRLRQFTELRLSTVDEVVRSRPDREVEELLTWEAVLHPAVAAIGRETELEQEEVFRKWQDFVRALGGDVALEFRRTVRGLTFVPVRLPANAADQAAHFNPLRAIRPMPAVRPIPPTPLRVAATGEAPPAQPAGQRPQSDLRVAVFDGGLDANNGYIEPFTTVTDLTPEATRPDFVAHGTLVTSALLYGAMSPGDALTTPPVTVDHFRVLPIPGYDPWDVDLYWILDRIEETLRAREDPIVSLSLGPDLSVDVDGEPHVWTATLDAIAAERGILFVSAVGNNGELDAQAGLNRLQVPADMINGLGVGACDRRAPRTPFRRCSYSAVGPGRAGARIQPAGVLFGGVVNGEPFRGIGPGGVLHGSAGTSFAAPAVAHGLAGLAAALGAARATSDNLRAFAVHFAQPGDDGTSLDEVGYGRLPEGYDDIWQCAHEEVTVLYEDTIERTEVVSLPFPLPAATVEGRSVTLRWTLAYTTPTDPTDAVDYAKSGLETAFRPHARRFRFDDPRTGRSVTLDLRDDAERVLELLRLGSQPSSVPVTRAPDRVRHEQVLREEGKWETVVHWSMRMRASGLFEPQLTIAYLARENGSLVSQAEPLRYTLLLTIRAPRGVPLYNATRQEYRVLDPLTARIPLRVRT
jgi:hypothetical protein